MRSFPAQTPSGGLAVARIVGVSPWAEQLRRDIERVAAHQSNVLILGPSGTGKELIARAIHALGNRAAKPFIPVDCAVTTGTLFASHMFGHVRGAFTGAIASALGCFRAADGGTIFLDEIGEMEPELQAKLLRVLQQRTVVPVGSHDEVPVNVRVLAATNRELSREVQEGRFREDLYYRLNVVTIRTVALRERPEDIPVIAERYLAELSARYGMPSCTLSPAALGLLMQYSWPGNVRELENVLERAVMFSSGDEIDDDAFSSLREPRERSDRSSPQAEEAGQRAVGPTAFGGGTQLEQAARRGAVAPTSISGVYRVDARSRAPVQPAGRSSAADGNGAVPERAAAAGGWPTLADVERVHLERTLAEAMYNKSLAAKLLGIDRSVLRRKLQRYGLDAAGGRDGDVDGGVAEGVEHSDGSANDGSATASEGGD
jgi:DNA-binding NtrC family response regulator